MLLSFKGEDNTRGRLSPYTSPTPRKKRKMRYWSNLIPTPSHFKILMHDYTVPEMF
jgi:hypothetical protein